MSDVPDLDEYNQLLEFVGSDLRVTCGEPMLTKYVIPLIDFVRESKRSRDRLANFIAENDKLFKNAYE